MWDPIGLVAAAMLKFRIDLQELWSARYGWADILPKARQYKRKDNDETINRLLTFKYDRKLKLTEGMCPPEVYGFADGGELVHGAAISSADGSHQCVLVIAKPFVAPLKQRPITRLERLGCVVLTRTYNTCQEVLAFVNFKEYE